MFFGVPGIGGRYSALSNFGMVPAAVMGVDVPRFSIAPAHGRTRAHACVPPEENPGVLLGAILGTLRQVGPRQGHAHRLSRRRAARRMARAAPRRVDGQAGKGIIPVDQEPLGAPDVYGNDRLFVYLRLDTRRTPAGRAVDALEKAGHPVVRIDARRATNSGRSSFAGRSRPRWPARSSASTPSISPMSKRARWRRES